MAFEIQTLRRGVSKLLDSIRQAIQQLDKSVGDFQSDREVLDHELALQKFTTSVQSVSGHIFKLVDETGGQLLNELCEIDKNLIQETLNLSLDLDRKDTTIPVLRPSEGVKRRDSEDTVDLSYGLDDDSDNVDNADKPDVAFDNTVVKSEKVDWDEVNGDAEDVVILKTTKKRGRKPKADKAPKVIIKTKGLIKKKRKKNNKHSDKREKIKDVKEKIDADVEKTDNDDDSDNIENETSREKPKRKYTKIMHSRFRCRICVKAFSSKAALKLHLQTSKHLKTLKKQKLAVQSVVDDNEEEHVKLEVDLNDLTSAMEVDEAPRKKKKVPTATLR